MLIKPCSADSDTRNVAKLFFISLKAQLFVFLLDFYTYLWLHIDLFVGVLLLFKSLYLCFICAKAQLFVFHVYIWLNLYFFVQNLSENLAKLLSYLWKPNCLYLPPTQQTIICLLVHFSQKRLTIICLFPLNLLPEKFPQYRNGSNGLPRIEYGDSALLCGYFESGGGPSLYLRSVKLSIMAS